MQTFTCSKETNCIYTRNLGSHPFNDVYLMDAGVYSCLLFRVCFSLEVRTSINSALVARIDNR
jgi:hypothetical protein